MVGGSIVLTLVFLFVESRAAEPIIPLRLFRNRTITLASLASLFVGIAMFAGTVYFSQYFQLARDKSPTMSGVMTIPMIGGLFVSSTVSGIIITRTGRWKRWLLAGGVLLTAGLGLLGTMRHDTPYWQIGVHMALMGLGVGMMMQNLVLCTQNQVAPGDLGAASSVVTFFRSLGGAVGVSVLGSVMSGRISGYAQDTIGQLGPQERAAAAKASGSGAIPDMDLLPPSIRTWLESAYGHGIADIFLYVAPVALLAFLVTLFIKEVPLRTTGALAQAADENATAPSGESESAVSAGGFAVRGIVRGADSAPVPQAAVTLISLGGRQLGRSVAQADGSYAVDAPGAGSYVLIAAAGGHQPQASTVVVDGAPVAHDILLGGTGGLTGPVRTAGTGAPVPDAMVIVTDARGDVLATGGTGEQGEFSFTGLVPGAVTVAVKAAGHRPRALPVEVGGTGVTRVEVDLETGARVQGVVRGRHGPLADARVTLVDAAGNVAGTATTGADGAYAFAGLDGGEYTVTATGYPPVATTATVTDGGPGDHDIELAHPGDQVE